MQGEEKLDQKSDAPALPPVLPIGAEVLPWKIRVKVERPQRSEDVRP